MFWACDDPGGPPGGTPPPGPPPPVPPRGSLLNNDGKSFILELGKLKKWEKRKETKKNKQRDYFVCKF